MGAGLGDGVGGNVLPLSVGAVVGAGVAIFVHYSRKQKEKKES